MKVKVGDKVRIYDEFEGEVLAVSKGGVLILGEDGKRQYFENKALGPVRPKPLFWVSDDVVIKDGMTRQPWGKREAEDLSGKRGVIEEASFEKGRWRYTVASQDVVNGRVLMWEDEITHADPEKQAAMEAKNEAAAEPPAELRAVDKYRLDLTSAWRCEGGCDLTEEAPTSPLYECGECGTMFSKNTSDSGTHRCDCGKFAARIADWACEECGCEETVEVEAVECPKCGELMDADDFDDHLNENAECLKMLEEEERT